MTEYESLPNVCHETCCMHDLTFSVTGHDGHNEYLKAWCEKCRWCKFWKLDEISVTKK